MNATATTAAKTTKANFSVADFLQMLFATIASGVVVSMLAAAIALFLAQNANAETIASAKPSPTAVVENGQFQPTPGTLLIHADCAPDPVTAIERDWNVTITARNFDIRVMQTFIVPEGEASTATFTAALPDGAKLLRLSAHTAGNVWQGKLLTAAAHHRLTTTDLQKLTRQRLLAVHNDDGVITTDSIINLTETEAVTVEYTYRLANSAANVNKLQLSLVNDAHHENTTEQAPPKGSVWVEWQGHNPRQLLSVPSGASLETQGTLITGLSWTVAELDGIARFQLAWSM